MVQFIDEAEPAPPAGSTTAPHISTEAAGLRATPWHLWLVGGISLLWNAFGANDYVQTQTGNLAYFETMMGEMDVAPAEALAYFRAFPAWQDGFWALGVWGAVAGSILLLLRNRLAVWAFALSLLGVAGTTVYQLSVSQPDWVESAAGMTIAIWSIATFLLIYAVSMRSKRVLR